MNSKLISILSLALILTACASPGVKPTQIDEDQEGQARSVANLPTAEITTVSNIPLETTEPESTHDISLPETTPAEVTSQETPGDLIYFWPEYVPAGYSIHVYADRTMVDELGYRLHFTAEGYVIEVDGGNPILPGQERPHYEPTIKDYCATFLCEPVAIGNFAGVKSNSTGAGQAFLWEIDGHRYVVGTTGPASTELEAVVKSLVPVSMGDMAAKIDQAP